MADAPAQVPSWLKEPERYTPTSDHDAFVARSMLSIAGVLRFFRLDGAKHASASISAPAKLLLGLLLIVLVSLSGNYLFTLVVLACLLLRCAFLRASALVRMLGVACTAGVVSFAIMLPAVFLGQPQSALLIGTKVFVSVGIAMCVALTTPFSEMTAGLRTFHIPNMFILTFDLALKNIVTLGAVALEVLTALKLRSVGKNTNKTSSMGGIGGVVFMKAQKSAQDTYMAMQCRGFEGEYVRPRERSWRPMDLLVLVGSCIAILLFVYLQGAL